MLKTHIQKAIVLISLLLAVQLAYADAGVPMIVFIMPSMIFLLIPIIVIEAAVLIKYLRIKFAKAIYLSAISNTVSTIVGIPLAWLFLLFFQMVTGGGFSYGSEVWWQKLIAVTWQAPWLIPYESDLYWMIPVAMTVLMIPFFLASWWVEGLATKKMVVGELKPNVFKGTFYANLASYIFIEILIFLYLIKDIISHY